MKIIIAKNKEEFDRIAADMVSQQLKDKPDSVLGLATGSTPIGLYAQLVERYKKGEIDFSKVKTFNLDEYKGLPKTHPQSYYFFMFKHLFSKVNIDPENIHIPNGEVEDSAKECEEYEKNIKEAGGIDLQILGIGHNGHIGFNEPGTPFESTTSLIDLDQRTIEANSRFFDSINEVPRQAISMGIKTIMQARKIVLMISGKDKAEIAAKAIKGPVTTQVPASVLQLHPFATVLLDQEAASLL